MSDEAAGPPHARTAFGAAINLNPHHIHAAVCDLSGSVVGEFAARTPQRVVGTAVLQAKNALDAAMKCAGIDVCKVRRLTIGMPGAFDPLSERLAYAQHLRWHRPTLLTLLPNLVPSNVALTFETDVRLAALAEQRLGVARGHDDFTLLWHEEDVVVAFQSGRTHDGEVHQRPLARLEVHRIAHRHGIAAPYRGPASPATVDLLSLAAKVDSGPYKRLLDQYAAELAVTLVTVIGSAASKVVVLSGSLLIAGGDPLRERIRLRLTQLGMHRAKVLTGGVRRQAVLRGALEVARGAADAPLACPVEH